MHLSDDEVFRDESFIPSDGGACRFVGAFARLYTFDTSFTSRPDVKKLHGGID